MSSLRKCYFIIFIPALLSCQKLIELEEQEFTEQLVLYCLMSVDEKPSWAMSHTSIELTHTLDILDSSRTYEGVNGAQIALYENDSFIEYAEESTILGSYSFRRNIKANATYKIMVNANGYPPVSTEHTTPKILNNVEIRTISPKPVGSLTEPNLYRLTYEIDDPLGANYYVADFNIVYTTKNGETLFPVKFWEVSSSLDPLEEKDTTRVFSDENFDGLHHARTIEFNYANEDNFKSDHIDFVLTLMHVSESYYLYHRTLELQSNSNEYRFTEPVQVYSNINGGIGLFASYSKSYAKWRVK